MDQSSTNKQSAPPDVEGGTDISKTPQLKSKPSDLSPTETARTSPTESMVSPTQKIKFEHSIETKDSPRGGNKSRSLLLGMGGKGLMVCAFIVGLAAFGGFGWFQIPGLNKQIDRLRDQVNRLKDEINRLSDEVDRLANENDRYESLNNDLNESLVDFKELNEDLGLEVDELQQLSDELNNTKQILLNQIDFLRSENERYRDLNENLNSTRIQLEGDVIYFRETLQELVIESDTLFNTTGDLRNLTETLANMTLNETLIELDQRLDNITSQVNRMELLNSDLLTVVSFLNDTSLGLGDNLQEISDYLADQIASNELYVITSTENLYRSKITNWDCEYAIVFNDRDWGSDKSLPIDDLDTVIGYVDERVLEELCLDGSNFESYLTTTYPDYISTMRLKAGIVIYTNAALDYYFPEADETGLSFQDWSAASFLCENLASKYLWSN